MRLKLNRCSCADLSGCVFCLRVTNCVHVCVCVRTLTFPVKIPVIQRHNAPRWLSVHRESKGGGGWLTCLILPLPAPCEARMCQPHTSSRCRGGCLCVRSTGLHTSIAAIAIWSGYTQQTLNDLWLAGSSKGETLWPLFTVAGGAAAGSERSFLQSTKKPNRPRRGWIYHETASESIPV